MNTSTLFLTAFQERWETFQRELENCRQEFSEGAVHDLRVATRRLLACLNMARAFDAHPRLQKVRRLLKEQIDDLDGLRDCQVMLVEINETLSKYPELKPIHTYLLDREKRLLRKARKQIKDFKLSPIEKCIRKTLISLEDQLSQPETQETLIQAVDDVYATALKRYAHIDAAQPATIHRLRLAFKKFRYMVEIIHPALPDFPQDQLKRMHDYQSLMGEVQDAEAFLGMLDEILEEDDTFDSAPPRVYLEELRAERISYYLDDKGELLVFWRSAPTQPFPWQDQSNVQGEKA